MEVVTILVEDLPQKGFSSRMPAKGFIALGEVFSDADIFGVDLAGLPDHFLGAIRVVKMV